MKKFILGILIALLINNVGIAGTIGGERPDRSPSWVGSIVNRIEDIIIKKAKETYNTQKKMEKASAKKPWYGGKSEKQKLQRELEGKENELKNCLSSKPTESKSDYVKHIVKTREEAYNDSNRPNNEVIELTFSLENINTIIKKYEERVNRNPSNYDIAIEYYQTYLICLKCLIDMHNEFISSAANDYPRMIADNKDKISKQISEIENELPKKNDSENIELLKSNKKYLETLLVALDEAKVTLAVQKKWAEDNLPKLLERKATTETTLHTAELTKNVSGLVTGIKTKFESLQVSMPPLILFKLDENKLKSK